LLQGAKPGAKAAATPEELAAAEAAKQAARADAAEADKTAEAAQRNYAQLERVRALAIPFARSCCATGTLRASRAPAACRALPRARAPRPAHPHLHTRCTLSRARPVRAASRVC
jgi:hypothetical protein